MWILKRYYLIDGINQLFAVIYLYLFMLEYFSSPTPSPPPSFFPFTRENVTLFLHLLWTRVKFAILLKLNE